MRAAAGSDALIATAVADALAATGMPFREAHDQVSRNLANLGSLAKEHGVTLDGMLAKKNALGGTAPERVAAAAKAALAAIEGGGR
jgi:argininosuccinate lyase